MNPASGIICEGESLELQGTPLFGFFEWTLPGASSNPVIGLFNPYANVTYATAGTYAITLQTTPILGGGGGTWNESVTVYANPTATLSSDDADNIICIGQDVTFTAGPAGQIDYEFFVNGSSVQTGTSTTYSTSTLANGDVVTVSVTNANGCTDTHAGITMTVNSFASPTATLSSDDADNTICTGTSVIFTAGPAGLANYDFYLNGSSVQNGTGTTYTTSSLSDGDVVTVTVTDANNCPDTHVGITTTVVAQPTLPTAVLSPGSPVCEGTDVFATITPGEAGLGCNEQVRARIRNIDGTTSRFAYTSEQLISTTGAFRVFIQARIRNCDAGCSTTGS